MSMALLYTAPAPRVRTAWNLMVKPVRNGQKFFILFGKKYYFLQKLKFSYYNNLFRNVFQTSGVIGLIAILYVRNSNTKKVFQLLEKGIFFENQVITISKLLLQSTQRCRKDVLETSYFWSQRRFRLDSNGSCDDLFLRRRQDVFQETS